MDFCWGECTCAVTFYVSGISLSFHLKLKAGCVLKLKIAKIFDKQTEYQANKTFTAPHNKLNPT